MQNASFYDEPPVLWTTVKSVNKECSKIDGTGVGERMGLSKVKKDKSVKFGLHEKYQVLVLYFVEKTPDGATSDTTLVTDIFTY